MASSENTFIEFEKLEKPLDNSIYQYTRSLQSQLLVAGTCFLLSIVCGISMGHISVLLPELQSNHSSIPTDKNTGAWLASVHSIIMPLGCFLGGTLGDWYGRRLTLMLSTGLFLVGWLFIAGAQNHIMLFIGRIIDGASKGIAAAICEVLIDEFSERSIRASISASLGVAYAIGAAIIYGFGTTSDWRLGPGIAAILSFITLIALFFLPETAVWLVRKRRLSEARCSLKWSYGSAKEVQAQHEFKYIVRRIQMENHYKQCVITPTTICVKVSNYWKMSMTSDVLKPFLISIVYCWLQIFCGTYLFFVYAVDLVSLTSSDHNRGIENQTIAILAGIARIFGFVFTVIILYWVGRRPLSILLTLGCSVSALALGIVVYTRTYGFSSMSYDTEKWFVVIFTVLYTFTNSGGFIMLPYIITGEMLPGRIRGFLCGVIFGSTDILSGCIMLLYPKMVAELGAHGIFFLFGITALAASIFLSIFLPETKGKTLFEIEDYFRQSNTCWFSRKLADKNQPEVFTELNDRTNDK